MLKPTIALFFLCVYTLRTLNYSEARNFMESVKLVIITISVIEISYNILSRTLSFLFCEEANRNDRSQMI